MSVIICASPGPAALQGMGAGYACLCASVRVWAVRSHGSGAVAGGGRRRAEARLCVSESVAPTEEGALPPRTAAPWSPPRPPRRGRTGPAGRRPGYRGGVGQDLRGGGRLPGGRPPGAGLLLTQLPGRGTGPPGRRALFGPLLPSLGREKPQIPSLLLVAENYVIVCAFKEI